MTKRIVTAAFIVTLTTSAAAFGASLRQFKGRLPGRCQNPRAIALLFVAWTAGTATTARADSTGSGVAIGTRGEVLTNAHVVENCAHITVRSSSPSVGNLVARDEKNDLAVVRSNLPLSQVVVFREGQIRAGDTVVALGYPLSGILATTANLSVGNVSALAGLRDDSRYLQISAPVQPGNSGGPLLDASGHLIGIVTAKLDALRVARATGDIPENVNFALKAEVAQTFLDSKGIGYRTARSVLQLSPADVGEIGRPFTVQIECTSKGPSSEARTALSPAPAPAPAPTIPVEPAPPCESTSVTNTLTRIGNSRGIAVLSIYPRMLSGSANMSFCAALAWTSAGKLAVTYTVERMNSGGFWVQVRSYSRTW